MAPNISIDNPVFYFSYATEDQSDQLTRFVDDLRHLVSKKMSLSNAQEVGFRDVENISTGDVWQEKLVDALQTSRMLVPNYSVNYFNSANCGREIQFYLMRAAVLGTDRETSNRNPMIVPVLWSSEKELISYGFPPEPLKSTYYSLPKEPDYSKRGLKRIISEDPALYDRIVEAFAVKIAELANMEPLPVLSSPPAFSDIPSLFQTEATEEFTQSEPHLEESEKTASPEKIRVDVDFPTLVFRLVVAHQLEVGDLEAFSQDKIDKAVKRWIDDVANKKSSMRMETKNLPSESQNMGHRASAYTKAEAMLKEEQLGIEPNPLWLSWVKIAHADKMESLKELLRDEP
jgi:hypothetical protein